MGLPYGEEIMIVGSTIWSPHGSTYDYDCVHIVDTVHGCVNGRTDRIMMTEFPQRMASRGKEAQLLLGDRATRKHANDC